LNVLHQETSPTLRNEEVFAVNPLGKVPVLLLDDGHVLFDSWVICEFFDGLHNGPKLFPEDDGAYWRASQLHAIAQGLNDIGITLRWETVRRPAELRYPALRDGYVEKLIASYDWLEQNIEIDAPLDVGQIAVATSLSWLEFRDLPSFRIGRPKLVTWFDRFEKRSSMLSTPLHGDTRDAAPASPTLS
jgi:glutathione S-transferase